MRNQLICLSVINIFLSITAFLGNILIVVVLYKESSLHPHSRLSFGNLAYHYGASCSYLLDVLGEQTFENLSLCIIHGYLSRLCVRWSGVSLPTLSAISVDRLLGLLLGLRYKQVATLKRTCVTVIVVWIISIFTSTSFLWNSILGSYCIRVIIILCLVTSVYCYTKIFLTLRHHQNQVRDNVHGPQSQAIPMNIARYKKAVSSALWLQLTIWLFVIYRISL